MTQSTPPADSVRKRAEHYRIADRLLRDGVATHDKISELDDARKAYSADSDEYADLTRQMDEYGKKAMGIWAQAQAHATLAAVHESVAAHAAKPGVFGEGY